MAYKEHTDQVGTTNATCLRFTKPWKGTGRIVVGDSWYGSVKSPKELFQKNELFSTALVKTEYKHYLKELLQQNILLNHGEWSAVSRNIDGIKMIAVLFKDLQER